MNLDNLLKRLSEDYSLGYERAKNEYTLEIDEDVAREKVNSLRSWPNYINYIKLLKK